MHALPRYLQALRVRAERAYHSPDKDRVKAEHLIPHVERYKALEVQMAADPNPEIKQFLEEFRLLLEEYRISLFAPEIKTQVRVSSKILDAKWREARQIPVTTEAVLEKP